jgi:hypothetical protein
MCRPRNALPGGPRLLALALTIAATALAACGDGDAGDSAAETTSTASEEASAPTEGGEKVAIKTRVTIDIPEGGPVPGSPISEGEVIDGSTIGESPFCEGGTFSDLHSDDPEIGLVDRTFSCPEGELRIGLTPGVPEGRTQSGPWTAVSGTGSFEGAEGDGQMKVTYEPETQSSEGLETFTGTLVP